MGTTCQALFIIFITVWEEMIGQGFHWLWQTPVRLVFVENTFKCCCCVSMIHVRLILHNVIFAQRILHQTSGYAANSGTPDVRLDPYKRIILIVNALHSTVWLKRGVTLYSMGIKRGHTVHCSHKEGSHCSVQSGYEEHYTVQCGLKEGSHSTVRS